MKNFRRLAIKAVSLLQSSAEIETTYPIIRQLGDVQTTLYRNHPGPKIVFTIDDCGFWQLETSIPDVDYRHGCEWSDGRKLSIQEDTELRVHLVKILQMWLHQDDLFSAPIKMATLAEQLNIEVKTLNRGIADGSISAFKVNKNLIRILKVDLPTK